MSSTSMFIGFDMSHAAPQSLYERQKKIPRSEPTIVGVCLEFDIHLFIFNFTDGLHGWLAVEDAWNLLGPKPASPIAGGSYACSSTSQRIEAVIGEVCCDDW